MPTYINFGTQQAAEDKFDYEFGSDPLVTTNPPSVGDSWVNTVTGEIFICIDKTTDNNIWKGTQGNTIVIIDWKIYGIDYSYIFGSQASNTDKVEKITLASVSSQDLGLTLSHTISESNGGKSETHGYKIGGRAGAVQTQVEKMQFSNETLSGLLTALNQNVGVGDSWVTINEAYSMGNRSGSSYASYINKYFYQTETDANIVATLNSASGNYGATVQNETTGWYWDSGASGLQKMTFSNENTIATVSQISATQRNGSSSDVVNGQGYYHGGFNWGRTLTKFQFANESTQANPLTLADDGNNWEDSIGCESETTGFIFGGDAGTSVEYDRIRQFNFASSGESEGTIGTLSRAASNTTQVSK
jgi:hypothetical protein